MSRSEQWRILFPRHALWACRGQAGSGPVLFPEYANRKVKDYELSAIAVEAARYRLGNLCVSPTGSSRGSTAVSWLLAAGRSVGVRDGSTSTPPALGSSESRS
jgi:hypothetical protein